MRIFMSGEKSENLFLDCEFKRIPQYNSKLQVHVLKSGKSLGILFAE